MMQISTVLRRPAFRHLREDTERENRLAETRRSNSAVCSLFVTRVLSAQRRQRRLQQQQQQQQQRVFLRQSPIKRFTVTLPVWALLLADKLRGVGVSLTFQITMTEASDACLCCLIYDCHGICASFMCFSIHHFYTTAYHRPSGK